MILLSGLYFKVRGGPTVVLPHLPGVPHLHVNRPLIMETYVAGYPT